jgi:hypothetical protein
VNQVSTAVSKTVVVLIITIQESTLRVSYTVEGSGYITRVMIRCGFGSGVYRRPPVDVLVVVISCRALLLVLTAKIVPRHPCTAVKNARDPIKAFILRIVLSFK